MVLDNAGVALDLGSGFLSLGSAQDQPISTLFEPFSFDRAKKFL